MDSISALSQQWKERDNKVFSQKAEVHIKEMKENTGTPHIDPLSRKVAEIVTRREMEKLGIQPKESIIKKSSQKLPKTHPKDPSKHSKKLDPVLAPAQASFPLEKPLETLSNPKIDLIHSEIPITIPEKNFSIPNSSEKEINNITNPILKKEPEIINEEKKRSEDMQNNFEHLQAFQEELQRDYPELALNNSIDGSSFHTNELNELEEACKDLSSEKIEKNHQSEIFVDSLKVENRNLLDQVSNMAEYTNSPCLGNKGILNPVEFEGESPIIPIPQVVEYENNTNKHSEDFKTPKKSEVFSKASKFVSIQELHHKDFANMQNSYMKASFLHAPQEKIQKSVPRCHINLTNCKSSPIFFSIRAHSDSKIKCDSGIGLVNTLRRLLLMPQNVENKEIPKDFFEKSLKWLQKKEEKLNEIRKNTKDSDLEGCTFDPFYEKHSTSKKKTPSFEYKACTPLSYKPAKSFTPKIPENTQTYSSLTPADFKIRCEEGFQVERFKERAKPMVPYRSINFLN